MSKSLWGISDENIESYVKYWHIYMWREHVFQQTIVQFHAFMSTRACHDARTVLCGHWFEPARAFRIIWGQDYKEKHKTRLKTNVKRTVLNNTKLRHFWAQIVSWAPIHARKTFIILAPGMTSWTSFFTGFKFHFTNKRIHISLFEWLKNVLCGFRYVEAGNIIIHTVKSLTAHVNCVLGMTEKSSWPVKTSPRCFESSRHVIGPLCHVTWLVHCVTAHDWSTVWIWWLSCGKLIATFHIVYISFDVASSLYSVFLAVSAKFIVTKVPYCSKGII